jgi:predicted TIM-barrel fold metal-dependent hydrolase
MIIDFHNHVHPPKSADHPRWEGKCPMALERVLAAQDRTGVDHIVISNAIHGLGAREPAEKLAVIREYNRFFAETQDKYSGRLSAFACALPSGGDAVLKELERAVTEDGLKGVMIMSSVPGHYPDDDDALPFFELVTRLDIPVMMHPPSVGFGEERLKDYRLASSIGRPMDLALALSRLIVRGIYEKFPTLKLVCTHLGGGISEMIGRMDYAYELQDEAYFLGDYAPMLITKKPSDYLRMTYLDCVSYHAPAARCAIETVGADHMIFGTDAPPLDVLKERGIALIEDMDLSQEDKDKIFFGNAKKLLKMD